MSNVQDYPSRISDANSRKLGTFSYLPPMTDDDIRKQVEFIVAKGWNPALEHTEPEHAFGTYWYMWKLPMFGETDVDTVLNEVQLCRDSNPGNHVRLVGYDNYNQTQGTALLVHRAEIKV